MTTIESKSTPFYRLICIRAVVVAGAGKIKKMSGILHSNMWEDNSEGNLFFT
jgi:hypothetical protein